MILPGDLAERAKEGEMRYGVLHNGNRCAVCAKDFPSWDKYEEHREETHDKHLSMV